MSYQMKPVDNTEDLIEALRIWIDDDPVRRERLLNLYLDGYTCKASADLAPDNKDLTDMKILTQAAESVPGLCRKREVFRLATTPGLQSIIKSAISRPMRKHRLQKADHAEMMEFAERHAAQVGAFARLVRDDPNVLVVSCYLFTVGARQTDEIVAKLRMDRPAVISALRASSKTGLVHGIWKFNRWFFAPAMRLLLPFSWDLIPKRTRGKVQTRFRGIEADILSLMPQARQHG